MRTTIRSLVLFLALLVAGCAHAPTFAEVSATLPPAPADQARLIVYRTFEPYTALQWTTLYLNGRDTGSLGPGAVLTRDVAPGQYLVSVRSDGLYPDQFKTVTVTPGQVVFVRVEALATYEPGIKGAGVIVTFVVAIVAPEAGRSETRDLWYRKG